MPQVDVNYVTVVVAAIIYVVVGFIWYGPLFGRRWMALMNITPSSMPAGAMAKTTLGSLVIAVVSAYVLSLLVDWTGATTAGAGITAGSWVWLGFVATITFNTVLYERRPAALWVLNNGYHLGSLALMGALLAVWS